MRRSGGVLSLRGRLRPQKTGEERLMGEIMTIRKRGILTHKEEHLPARTGETVRTEETEETALIL